ncbi:MAG TPA: hypothetical protein VGR28_05150 [Candidatus Thermoplasmatota archaeon]|nr:hypothetical protein [Candidatus Thermoplasmatota archaeon]
MKAAAALLALLTASVAVTGCFGAAKQEAVTPTNLNAKEITNDTSKRFEELTQVIPSNYTFPGQRVLEHVLTWYNDTIDTTADTAFETPQDDGGMNFTTILKTMDVSSFIPPRQPAEVHITLWWSGNPGQSADLDIFTVLPGDSGAYDPGTGQEMNWNIPVKRRVVDTVGVEGHPMLVGVQATNGRIAPGSAVDFHVQIEFDYTSDVLTAYHPYAFTVPEGATGLVLHSEKITGDEHIDADFVVIGPDDNPISYQTYNDIAIPTESVFIPTRGPGEYVFYAYHMNGGFLSMKADAPVPVRDVRILPLKEESTVDFSNPLAPGVAEHNLTVATGLVGPPVDGLNVATPYQEGTQAANFNVEDTFPLRIHGFFAGNPTLAGDAEVRILNANGIVYDAVRGLRADLGDQGSLGWSGDAPPWATVDYSLLAKGAYTVSVVADGYTGQIGHTILTYERGSGGS